MTDKPNAIRPGEVTIDLTRQVNGEDKPWTLRLVPSLTAATNLNRKFGGMQALIQRVGAYDLDAYAAIIQAGAGVTDKYKGDLLEAVYRKGILNLIVPLTQFCTTLANGGRPIGEDKADDPEEAAEADPLDE